MRFIFSIALTAGILAGMGCSTPELHLICRDAQTGTVAETDDQHAIRNVLDLANRLESWNKAEPIGADHLFTVRVRKLEEEKPYMEMEVFHKHTRLIMLNDPDDPSDDESVNLKTSSNLKFALSDVGGYSGRGQAVKPEAGKSNVEP